MEKIYGLESLEVANIYHWFFFIVSKIFIEQIFSILIHIKRFSEIHSTLKNN